MTTPHEKKFMGRMFLLSGVAFLVAAAAGGKLAFAVVGVAFLAIGGGMLHQVGNGQ